MDRRVIENATKRIVAIAATAAALVLVVATIGAASTHKTVTIKVGEATKTIDTWAVTAEGALEAAHVSVGHHDVVFPSPGTALSDGDTVTVRQAVPVKVINDGKSTVHWTVSQSFTHMIASEKNVKSIVISQKDSVLPLTVNPQKVHVTHDGTTTDMSVDPSKTLQQNLASINVTLNPLDRVELTLKDGVKKKSLLSREDSVFSAEAEKFGAANSDLVVTRIERSIVEKKIVKEKAPVEERTDDSLYKGQTKVIEEGSDDVRLQRIFVEKVNGKVAKEEVLSEKQISTVKKRIVAKGTKPVPAGFTPGSFSGGDPWAALAQCEAGGNPARNSGNGYYGMYQFSLSTWRSVGGSGLPSEASAEEQTMRAKMLQARSGWGQWPACTRRLGLR